MDLFDHPSELALIGHVAAESRLDVSAGSATVDRLGVKPSDFHLPAHQDLYSSVVGLIRSGNAADPVAAWAKLRASKHAQSAGGWDWVFSSLQRPPGTSGAVVSYASVVLDLSLRRQAQKKILELQADIENLSKPSCDLVAKGERDFRGLMGGSPHSVVLSDYLPTLLEQIEEAASGKREPIIPTGIHLLDQQIGGLQPTLTVIGALAGVGKSALISTIVANLASRVKVGIFSLEDERSWLPWRLLARHSGMTQRYLREGRFNEHQQVRVGDAFNRLRELAGNILVDDRSALTPQEVVNGSRDMIVNRGVRVIIVDHLGELRYPNGRKERFDLDISEGLSDLRSIAKQYGAPVVCASHLNRATDGGELRLSSFANSSAIERQARVALGLQRKLGSEELLVTVLKQTNGPAGAKFALDFDGPSAMVKSSGGRMLREEARPDASPPRWKKYNG